MKILLAVALLLTLAATVRARSSVRLEGAFTVEWRQMITAAEQPTPSLKIGDIEIAIRPMPRPKEKDPPRGALCIGDASKSSTLIYPGKWYHFALVGKGGKTQLFVNGFPDGQPAATALAGEPITDIKDMRFAAGAMTGDEILARFKSALSPRPITTVAHRGVHKHAPENTRISYVMAVEAGAPVVEFDTALTADGQVVGLHDKTVDRTTDGTGKVAEMTLEQLRKLDAGSWKDPKYKDEPIPTLDDVAEVVLGKAILMLDLKAEGQGSAIAKWLESSKFPHDQLILAPWEDHEGVALRKHVPADVPMIRLTSKVPTNVIDDAYFAKMKSMGFSGFSVNWQYLSEDFTRAAQKNGMKVYVWTLNDAPDVAGAAVLGVDGVVTDDSGPTIKLLSDLHAK